MLFGQKIKYTTAALILTALTGTFYACKQDPAAGYSSFSSPAIGLNVASGKTIDIKIDFAKGKKIDSVVYLLDSARFTTAKDTNAVQLKTAGIQLGNHLLTGKIYSGGEAEELTTNVNILSATAPQEYTFKVLKTLPHDTSSYIEGLEYHDGFFYESAGSTGESSLRKVNVESGKILQKKDLDSVYFGEGITVIGNKILQLTWQNKVAFVYDKATFKKLSEFPFTVGREGWGLTYDGKKIIMSDGSNTLYFLDKDTYKKIGSVDVFDNRGPVDSINELEYIDGKIYANVYTKNIIIIINPENGEVEGQLDLSSLYPQGYFKTQDEIANNVLNGIAYNPANKSLYVTGKKWPKLYEIKVVKK